MIKAEEIKINHAIPGEIFVQIARNPQIDGNDLYMVILEVLLEKCFSCDVSPLKERVLEVMPEMDSLLLQSNTQNRSLKIAVDVGKLAKINREQESRLVYEAALIVLMFIHIVRETPMNNPPNVSLFESYEEIHSIYGSFKEFSTYDILELEQRKLLAFSNIMKAALVLMSKPKKAHLLDLVTRISEGRLAKYITGSGQTILTARRVQIFQSESGVTPQPRPPRRPKEFQGGSGDEMVRSSTYPVFSTYNYDLTRANSVPPYMANAFAMLPGIPPNLAMSMGLPGAAGLIPLNSTYAHMGGMGYESTSSVTTRENSSTEEAAPQQGDGDDVMIASIILSKMSGSAKSAEKAKAEKPLSPEEASSTFNAILFPKQEPSNENSSSAASSDNSNNNKREVLSQGSSVDSSCESQLDEQPPRKQARIDVPVC